MIQNNLFVYFDLCLEAEEYNMLIEKLRLLKR